MVNNIKALLWAASLSALAGLILIFSSTSFGVAQGQAWLQKQYESADFEIYKIVVEKSMEKFMVLGGILFGAGLLVGILTYFSFLRNANPAAQPVTEKSQVASEEM